MINDPLEGYEPDINYRPTDDPRPIPANRFKAVTELCVPDDRRDDEGRVPLSESARAALAAAREPANHRHHEIDPRYREGAK